MAARQLLALVTAVLLVTLVTACCPTGPSVRVTPSQVELAPGGTVDFTAHVTCLDNTGVTWSATCGTLAVSGRTATYTAPAEPGSCTVTAVSVVRSDVRASATVTVATTAPPDTVSVVLAPAPATVAVNGTLEFTATVTGATDTSVTWAATCGAITGTGSTVTYTAPAEPTSCTVTATSAQDTSKSASSQVTVWTGGGDPGFALAPTYITITNSRLLTPDLAAGTRAVRFDISWPESWRGPDRPSWVAATDNWDAAWVFIKYRVDGGAWQHATLHGSGHAAPAGAVIAAPADGAGAVIHRAASGYGVFSAEDVRLVWDHAADGVVAEADLDVIVFALEMVYVPTGSFVLGDAGSGTWGEFRAGGTGTTQPFAVTSQGSISLGDVAGRLYWAQAEDAGAGPGSPSGSTNASFPTGYEAFYAMKHQVMQGQYVNFLNTLTQTQATARHYPATEGSTEKRYVITGFAVGAYGTSLPYVPHGYMSWADSAAFAAWAGLRPMTELEYEKAGRGTALPVERELAWGTRSTRYADGVVNAGTITERPTPTEANIVHYLGDWDALVRAGSFAAPGRSRERAGAGFYGVLDLSGYPNERTVTVGNAEGQSFTGVHGDGSLRADGLADVSSWPGVNGVGAGTRGGDYWWPMGLISTPQELSNRFTASADVRRGGSRAVRSAP